MTSQKIVSEIDAQVKAADRYIKSAPWADKAFYAAWCVQTFKYVSHSAPLIKLCADRLPKSNAFKREMEKHYREEVGHEQFALRDAKFFGIDAKMERELDATKSIYDAIYAEIEADPMAMFGYALALENISKHYGPWIAETVCYSYGIDPKKAFKDNVPASFLTLHAHVDQDHADSGLTALEKVPPNSYETVYRVMMKTFRAYQQFLEAIERESVKNGKSAA
jgi:pyrroloquinoline quinone (PQQ) biosynthesis protein C